VSLRSRLRRAAEPWLRRARAWRDDRLLRRIALLSTGVMAGQAVAVLVSPLLTRLYTPEEFGLFALVAALSGILGTSVGLRFELAVPGCHDDGEAACTVALTMLACAVVALLLGLGIGLGGHALAEGLGAPAVQPLLWLLPLMLLLWGWGQPLVYWSIRRGSFRMTAINRTLQLASQAFGQLALAVPVGGGLGLTLGYALGYLLRLAHHLWALPAEAWQELRAVRLQPMWRLAREHRRYPAFSLPSALLQSTAQFLPALLLAPLYGPAVAGLFALAQRMLDVPIRLLSNTASEAFLGEVARLEPAAVQRIFLRTAKRFLALGLVGMAPLLLAGPALFALAFGEPWREAGSMVQCLVPVSLARFVVIPISQTLYVVRRQDLHLISAVLNLTALAGAFLLGWWLEQGPLATLLVYSLGSSLAWMIYGLSSWWAVRAHALGHTSTSPPAPATAPAPRGGGEGGTEA
jgi:O-antigen/teichoic acid export membrane protein